MKLAFYRADRSTKRKWLAKLVDWWTGNHGYSHVELIFSDGISFSSSDRDGGTRFKRIEYHPDRWVIIDLPFSSAMESLTRERAQQILGNKYDYLGIFLWHLIPLKIQDGKRWWCDEACAWAIGMNDFRNNPNKLAKIFKVKPAEEYP